MPVEMGGHIGATFNTQPEGGVTLEVPAGDGYYDYANGGIWVESPPTVRALPLVNIQPADAKTMEYLVGMGGTANPRDVRVIHLNDGTSLYPQDEGRGADVLIFSDGLALRRWRVRSADNRPWHNYCRAIVERELPTDGN